MMDMETIKQVAWVGDSYVMGGIRGVVLVFHGLGFTGRKTDPSTEELSWARAGGLVVHPYYGPWSWMNRQARAMVDELVDSIYAAFGLADTVPLISTGGSMGGCSALLYSRYAKRPIAGCLANVPACDVKVHYNERPDLPVTFMHAFAGYPESRESILAEHSPVDQVDQMPDVPYLIVAGDQDKAVAKSQHADRMVALMRERGLKVEYIEVPGMGHGGPVPIEVVLRKIEFVKGLLAK